MRLTALLLAACSSPVFAPIQNGELVESASRCGRKLSSASFRSLIHFTRTGLRHFASIVSDGALWRSNPRLLAEVTAPYPQTVVAGSGGGRICWANCFMEIS